MKSLILPSILIGILCCSLAVTAQLQCYCSGGTVTCKGYRFGPSAGGKRQWEETPIKENHLNDKKTEVVEAINNLLVQRSAQGRANHVNKIKLIDRIVQDLNMHSYEWQDSFEDNYVN